DAALSPGCFLTEDPGGWGRRRIPLRHGGRPACLGPRRQRHGDSREPDCGKVSRVISARWRRHCPYQRANLGFRDVRLATKEGWQWIKIPPSQKQQWKAQGGRDLK